MAQKSIKKNFIFSLVNKAVAVLIPILITPYLARVLEPDGNGVISFVSSMASYFVLLSNLGIETYGQREMAIHREDRAFIKKFIIEITLLRLIFTVFSLVVYYFLFISSFNAANNILYAIYAMTIIAVIFDFSWLFQGVEKFGTLAVTSLLTRAAYIVLIFVLVKTKADIAVAAALTAANAVLPFILCLPFMFGYMTVKTEGGINPFRHFKECMIYFIPTIAVQIYTVVDKTMIGLITRSDFENGYYEQAEKIVKLPITIVTTLNVIIRSRISYYYSLGEQDKIQDLTEKSANLSLMLMLPITFGIVAVTYTFVPIYLGEGYEKCILLMYIFSPILLIISVSNLLGTHYYTPFDKQRISNRFLVIGAVVNIALNSFMIYFFQSMGAAISSVLAELVITVLYLYFARNFFTFKRLLKICLKYFIASVVMFVPVFFMNRYLPANLWYLLIEVAAGVAIYALMLFILRPKFFTTYVKLFFNKFKELFKRNES